jgi:large subunit ribosomal protein L10e
MRGAFGKPYGTVARVNIGQIIFSVRSKDASQAAVIEALRRAKYKFAGRQKIVVSKKWGFTKLNKEDYHQALEEGLLQPDGCYVKYLNHHGPLSHLFKRLTKTHSAA